MIRPRQSPRPVHQRGLTLVEMLLATASTALIGLAIAGMLSMVAYGTQDAKDARSLVVQSKAVNTRLTAAIRQAGIVLAANTANDNGDDWIILWVPAADAVATSPRRSELHRLEYNSTARTLRSFRNTSPTGDVTYALTDNFKAITDALISSGTLTAEIWATGVDHLALRLNGATVQDANLVSYRLTLRHGNLTEQVVSAAALRNRALATGP